jgi:tetratricopeptide (TPR) repeat protein
MLMSMPIWIIFSSIGVCQVWQWCKQARSFSILKRPRPVLFLVSLCAAVSLHSHDSKAQRPDEHLWYTLGEIYFEQKDLDASLAAYTRARALNRNAWMPVIGVCKVYFSKGKQDAAAKAYERLVSGVNEEVRRLILRDKDLDPIRQYIATRASTQKLG